MQILPFGSSYPEQNTYKNNTNFKGMVSPEFIQYVNEIREDCLLTCTAQSSELLNNVCDNIINKSRIVMEKCFHPSSFLSVDTSGKIYGENNDVLFIQNKIVNKLIGPDYDQGFLSPRGYKPPRARLNELLNWIYGMGNKFFHEAFCKNLFKIDAHIDEYNIETATEIKDILEWGRNNFSSLSSVFPNYSKEYIEDVEGYREEVITRLNEQIKNLNILKV